MTRSASLLVIHHSPTPSMRRLAEAVLAGTGDEAIDDVEVVVRAALETTADDVLAADGYVLGTSANFGYMSGALKHFFDSTFLQIGGSLAEDGSAGSGPAGRKPFGLWVHGNYDTTGAVRSVLAITGALPWTQAAPVLEVLGDVSPEQEALAYELGATLSALLSS